MNPKKKKAKPSPEVNPDHVLATLMARAVVRLEEIGLSPQDSVEAAWMLGRHKGCVVAVIQCRHGIKYTYFPDFYPWIKVLEGIETP